MTIATTFVLAGIIAFVTFWFFLWLTHFFRLRKLMGKFPGPPTLPLLGNAHMLKEGAEFYEQIMYFTQDYTEKRAFRIWLGPLPMLAIYGAEAVESLLSSSKHMEKSYDYTFLMPWLKTGLLTSTGDKWKSRRRLLTPTFHFKILEDFMEVFNEQSKIMIKHLENHCGKEKFDIFPYITLCALDIICESAMGRTVNAQQNSDSEYVKAVYKISELVQNRQIHPWVHPDFIYNLTANGKEHQWCLEILHGFTRKIIQEQAVTHEKLKKQHGEFSTDSDTVGKKKRLAFLDMLLSASDNGKVLNFDDIQEEVDTFMFEGHDTTAAAMSWAIYFIGSYPEVQQRLHDEVDDIFGDSDRDATIEDVKKLKYLDCVIKESLRLYPSVPIFARKIKKDTHLGEHFVPGGCTAVVITSALHRDPKYFPNPDKFDPDRFLPENADRRHPFAYVPFSAGFRNCIGQRFAVMEEKVLLSSILRHFDIESMQREEDLMPVGALILRPQEGIIVKLKKRKTDIYY